MTARDWIDLVQARGGVLSVRSDELYVEPDVLTAAEREGLNAVKLEVIAALAEDVPGLGMSRAALLELIAEAEHLQAVGRAREAGEPLPQASNTGDRASAHSRQAVGPRDGCC